MTPFHFSWLTATRQVRVAAAAAFCALATAGTILADEVQSAGEAAGEVAEGAKGGLEPLAFQTDLALWTGVIFIGLLIILGKFAFRPIVDALDAREKSMADKVAETEAANAAAKSLEEVYQQKLSSADDEVKKIIAEAKDEANKKREELLAVAQADADEVRAKGKRDVDADREQMLNDLANRSATWATDLAGKILKQKISPEDYARLIEGAVQKFTKG